MNWICEPHCALVIGRVTALSIFAPAKLNLFLAVTGRRTDRFHDLVSLVAPLDLGDTLQAEPAEKFTLTCDDSTLLVDESNLVLKAARAQAAATGWRGGAAFSLVKRIPIGAGLGGGSSDAVAALRAANQISGRPLGPDAMSEVAAGLGSDCPMFLHAGPVIIRGRGERVEPLPSAVARRLSGRRVLLFKPGFGIGTPWAYARLAALAAAPSAAGLAYLPAAEAEARLAAWTTDETKPIEALLYNGLETAVFGKFLALPALLDRLRADFGLTARMSGSGSACFALLREDTPVDAVTAAIQAAWGSSAFVTVARMA